MAHAISVRLDEDAERALRSLEAAGMSRSEAIRRALVDAAVRLSRRDAIAAEVAALESDPDDRHEMAEVASFMEQMRAPGVTSSSSRPQRASVMSNRADGTR
jgi:hypothetical protein